MTRTSLHALLGSRWAIVVAVVLLIIGAIGSWIEGSAECERKGGVYFCARGSTCICLAPGVVLP